MSKHTPGPWVVGNKHMRGGVFAADGQLVAGTHGASRNFDREAQILEQDANARLIAAAPELLEALGSLLAAYSEPDQRICCSGFDCGCMGATTYQQAEHYARAAIAKAKGEGA